MIYEAVKNALEAVEALKGKVYPAGVCIDEVEAPFAVYSFGKRTAECDLSGAVHHYTDEASIDLLAATYDEAHALYCLAEDALQAVANGPDSLGEYIFGVDCDSPEADGADLAIGLVRRTLRGAVQWCPLE